MGSLLLIFIPFLSIIELILGSNQIVVQRPATMEKLSSSPSLQM
uniref:Uncharacterized protein n=1 Tax=Solanum lycopersicum TaxID=4081 RepID=K4CSC3_SOLLC